MPGAYNPQAWNRYAYGLNNPSKYNDPTGHDPHCTLMMDDQCFQTRDGPRVITRKTSQPKGMGLNPASSPPSSEDEPYQPAMPTIPTDPTIQPSQSSSSIPTNPTPNPEMCGNNGDACIVAGALLIVFTDLFVGLPLVAVIVLSGGATPPAIAAEALETLVVLPINIFGIYLISKGIEANKR